MLIYLLPIAERPLETNASIAEKLILFLNIMIINLSILYQIAFLNNRINNHGFV